MLTHLTEKQSAILGSIGSTTEVCIQYPLNIIKNQLQYNSKIHISPSFLYKGIFINMISLGYITSSQFYLFKHFYNFTNNNFLSSFSSGILSGLFSSPTELFVIQKFKYNSFLDMHSTLKNRYGFFKFYTRGLYPCMMREGIYTTGMLSLTPYIEQKLNSKEHKIHNSLVASIISGFISGTISHPFDTMKTIYQYDFDTYNKPKNYFRGYIPRIIRITGTYFIINECNNRFYDFVTKF